MAKNGFRIHQYDKSTLYHHIFGDNERYFPDKTHIAYLKRYLCEKEVKTILIEEEYIDRHYLEDYSEYYVRCFEDYVRKCRRIHFFAGLDKFTDAEFRSFLEGSPSPVTRERLQKDYVGFLVIKPLPETLIGRTCLEAYKRDGGTSIREYPVTKSYEVGLFGINLKVKDSLPFQEQDKVVAACATSALWSLFHGINPSPSFQIRSPSQITKAATKNFPLKSTGHPIPGLTPEMIGHALVSEGLEAQHISIAKAFENDPAEATTKMKEILYAYLKNKIPILLGIDVYSKSLSNKSIYSYTGKHAVTVCGFSIPKKLEYKQHGKFCTKADFIEKLFVHDDQIGPFAKIEFVQKRIFYKADEQDQASFPAGSIDDYLSCGIEGDDSQVAIPNNLMFGLYHKIRIPYLLVRDGIFSFNAVLDELFDSCAQVKEAIFNKEKVNLIWDIHLITSNDAKDEIMQSHRLTGKDLRYILTKHMPKYMWRARAEYDEDPLFDLFFDATDILQGKVFITSVEYNEIIKSFFNIIFGDNNAHLPECQALKADKQLLVNKIIKGLGTKKDPMEDILTSRYGRSNPPLNYKPHEINEETKTLHTLDNVVILMSKKDIILDGSKKYLWAVSCGGDLLFAPEAGDPPLGHPNLLNGNPARVCGELIFKDNEWILNNASGRYSKYAPDITNQILENVKELFEKFLPAYSGKIKCDLSDYHGPNSQNSIDDVLAKLKGFATQDVNHDALNLLVDQIIFSGIENINARVIYCFTGANIAEKVILSWFLHHYWRKSQPQLTPDIIPRLIYEYNQNSDNQMLIAILSALLIAYQKNMLNDNEIKELAPIFTDYVSKYSDMPKVNVLEGILAFLQKAGNT